MAGARKSDIVSGNSDENNSIAQSCFRRCFSAQTTSQRDRVRGLLNPIVIEFLSQHPTPLIIARQSLLSFIQSRVESQSSSGLKTIVTTSPIELSIGLTVS